jgi:hypothetical protein
MDVMFGVADGSGLPSNAVLATLFVESDGNGMLHDFYVRNGGSYSQVGGGNSAGMQPLSWTPIYLRLTRLVSGPTWTMYVSRNGVNWTRLNNTSSKSLTVSHVTLRLGDGGGYAAIDWIRAWDAIVEKVGA